MNDERAPTFGEKAVGLDFNPSGSGTVHEIKVHYARIIDLINGLRDDADMSEAKRMYSVAITEAQSSQMWAVKACTWRG